MAFNRSLAVKSQWRDRYGRWVEMGRGVRFYNPATNSYDIGTFEGPTADGQAKIKLPNGENIIAPKSAVEAYTVKARLDGPKMSTPGATPEYGTPQRKVGDVVTRKNGKSYVIEQIEGDTYLGNPSDKKGNKEPNRSLVAFDESDLKEDTKASLPKGTGESNLVNAEYDDNGNLTLDPSQKPKKASELNPGDTFYNSIDSENPNVLETEPDGIPASSLVQSKDNKEVTFLDPQGNEKKMSLTDEVFQQNAEDEDAAMKAEIISEEKHLAKAPIEDPYEPTDPNKDNFGPLGKKNPKRIINDTLPPTTPSTTSQAPNTAPSQTAPSANPLDSMPEVKRNKPEALPGEKFAPTQEQQDVIDAVLSDKNVKVSAKAGAGKTSTLEALSRRIEKDEPKSRALYIAFNKSVQTEAEGRMPSNVEPRTGHSLAYQWASKDKDAKVLIQKQSKKGDYKNFKPATRTSDMAKHLDIQNLPNAEKEDDDNKKKSSITSGVVETVKNFQNSADDNISSKHLPDRFSEFTDEEKAYVADKAKAYWNDMFSPSGKMAPNFDTYRKAWALSKPDLSSPSKGGGKKKANLLYIDEAQDTPPVLAKVVADQNMRKVIVGDASQAIYGFTGATDYLSEASADVELPLTQSFRFGPAVADAGNRFLQLIGDKHRVIGGGPDSKIVNGMENPDAILVRTNRGLIQESINELKKDRVVAVPKGTKANLTSLVDSVLFLKGGFGNNKPKKMHEDLESFENWGEVHKEIESSGNQGLKSTAALFDNLDIDGQTGLDAMFTLRDRLKTIKEPGDASEKVEMKEDSDSLTIRDTGTVGWGNSPIQTLSTDYAKSNGAKAPYEKGNYQGYIDNLENAGGISTRGWNKKSEGVWEFQGTEEERNKEKDFINKEFLGNGDVMISTAHKSKGLEWDRVKIGDDFGIPEEDPNTGELQFPSKDELMLDYVSVTRAKKELDPGSLDWVYDYSDENGGVPETNSDQKATIPESTDLPIGEDEDTQNSTSSEPDMTEDVEESIAQEEAGEAQEPEGSDTSVPDVESPSDEESKTSEDATSSKNTNKELDSNGNSVSPSNLQAGDPFEDEDGNSYTTEKVAKNGIVLAKDENGEIEPFFPEDIHNAKSQDDDEVEDNPDSKQKSLNDDNDGDDTADKPSGGEAEGPGTPPEPPLPEWIPGDVNKPGEGGPEGESPSTPTPTNSEDVAPSTSEVPVEDTETPSEAPEVPSVDSESPEEESLAYGPGTYDANADTIPDISVLKKTGNQTSGSNPGGFYTDPSTGRQFYVKEAKTESHALNEAVASKFYSEAGVPNAEQHARMLPNGKWGTISELVPGAKEDLNSHIKAGDQEYLNKIREGFAVDAWLANWDVAGLTHDNVVTDENGDPVRVDPGGSLVYRAQGAPKGNAFGNDATEWESLRGETTMKSTATPIFQDMTDKQLFDSANKVMSFDDDRIDAIVDSVFFDVQPDIADSIKDKLKNRRNSIQDRMADLDPAGDFDGTTEDDPFLAQHEIPGTDEYKVVQALSNEPGIKGEDDTKEWDLTPAYAFHGDEYDEPEGSVPGYTTTGGYTDQAKEALSNYIDESGDINAVLRGDDAYFEKIANQVGQDQANGFKDSAKTDIAGLKTLMDLPEEGESTHSVFRGIGLTKETEENPDRIEYFKALATPGSVVSNGGFTSTSYSKKMADGFNINTSYSPVIEDQGKEIPGSALVEISLHPSLKRHAVDYEDLENTGYENEQEVILDTDTIFVVTGSNIVDNGAGDPYTEAKAVAYPKSALTDGTLQNDFPEYDFPTLGGDNNGAEGEQGTDGDSEGDSAEVPTPATDGEGIGQAETQTIAREELTDGSIEFHEGDVIEHTIGGVTRRAVKTGDGSWEVSINGSTPVNEGTENDVSKTIKIIDSLYPGEQSVIEYTPNGDNKEITPGDVVTTEDGDSVKVTEADPESDSYVGEILDETGQPDLTEAPKSFDGEEVDHKGSEDSSGLEDWEKALLEGVDDLHAGPTADTSNYEPASDATQNKNQVDEDGNPLDKAGNPIKKGSSVQLHKANGDLWIEGVVDGISKDKKRIKVKDSVTGKSSYRLPHKITVVEAEEGDPIVPKPPQKTEQKVSSALAGLEDGELINVSNNDKSFVKNTNDNGDPVLTDQDTEEAQEIPEFIQDNSETETDSGVSYSNLEFVPESKETSSHSQDDEGDQTPEGYPDNMGTDSLGFQYIRSANNEKMYVGDFVTNNKGELVGKITAFDGGKLLGKRLKVERPDGKSVYRKPTQLHLYKDEDETPAPTSIDEILDDPLLDGPIQPDPEVTEDEANDILNYFLDEDTKSPEDSTPTYETIGDAALGYSNGEITLDQYKEIVEKFISEDTTPSTPEEESGPINEQTEEPAVSPVSFDILPADERGQSGDGYHSSGPWGKFGASGMMIEATDPSTGEKKYLLTQRSQSLSSNKGKWQLPGGAKDELETDYQGAARETSEELGLDQDELHQLSYVSDNIYDNGQGWTYNNIAVTSPTMYDVVPQDMESSDAKWFTKSELNQMKNQGDLVPAFAENIDVLMDSFGNEDSVDIPAASSEEVEGVEGIDFATDMNGNTFSVGDEVDWPAQKKTGTVNAVMSSDKVHVFFSDGSSKNLNPNKKLKAVEKTEEPITAVQDSDKPVPPETSDIDKKMSELESSFALGIPTQDILDDMNHMFTVEKKHASTKSHYKESKYFKIHGPDLKEDSTDKDAIMASATKLNEKYLLSDEMFNKIGERINEIEADKSGSLATYQSLAEQKKETLKGYETELKAWNKANGIKINTKLGAKIAPVSNEAQSDLMPSSWNESLPGTSNLDSSLEFFETDVPSRSNGVGILVDTGEIEYQEMRVNRLINSSGDNIHRSTFRVNGSKIDGFLKNFQGKFGSQIKEDKYKVKEQKIQDDGQLKEYDTTANMLSFSDGIKRTVTLPDGTKISYSVQDNSSHQDPKAGHTKRPVFDGLVEIDSPVEGGSEAINNALKEFGITEARPTNSNDLKREAAKLLYSQIKGFQGYYSEGPDDVALNKFLKKLEKDTGIKLSDVQMSRDHLGTNKFMLTKEGLEKLKKTYTPPKTYVHGFSGGVYGDELAKNLSGKTPGLVSSKQRYSSGIQSGGMSVYQDMGYGSTNYVFLRPSTDEYRPGLHLNSDIVYRHLYQVHANTDSYGKPKMNAKPWKDQTADYFVSNAETEIPFTLDASAWKYYVVSSTYDKDKMVNSLKKHGTYTINGIPVEEFIVVKGGALPQYDDSMLEYSGDENATIIPDGPIGGV